MSSPSKRRQTAQAVVEAYNSWSLDAIMDIRTEDCISNILPPMNNEAYKTYFGSVMPYFEDFTVTINDIYEDEKANKVVLWAQSTATTPLGPYSNEYMLILHMNEEGDKINQFFEFVDSASSVNFFPKLHEYIVRQKSAEAK